MQLLRLLSIFIIIITTIVVSVFGYPANEYEGKKCGDHFGGTTGICTAVPDCPAATNSLIKHHYHGLQRCGFAGFTEIVCCPNKHQHDYDDRDDHDDHNKYDQTHDGGHLHQSRNPLTTTTSSSSNKRRVPNDDNDRNDSLNKKPNFSSRKSLQICDEYSNETPPKLLYQILGGENAQIGEFPHMAALGYNSSDSSDLRWDCGGTLISDKYILTAAHCAKSRSFGEPVKVRLGKVDITGNADNEKGQDYDVEKVTVHPQYVRRTRHHDIALIKLTTGVSNSQDVHPACLYSKNDDPEGLVATGWGATELGGSGSNILQKVTLNSVSITECNNTYVQRINRVLLPSQLCAKSDDGKKDTCQGDSGGPIQIQHMPDSSIYTIVGVTSFGIGCGGPPGVYTRVSSYLDWIENIVWP